MTQPTTDNVRFLGPFQRSAAALVLATLLTAGSAPSGHVKASGSAPEVSSAEAAVDANPALHPSISPLQPASLIRGSWGIEGDALPSIEIVASAPVAIEAPKNPHLPLDPLAPAVPTASDADAELLSNDFVETANRDPQELLQFGEMHVPRWVVETILRASEVTGVDPVYMMALADKESSFLPESRARTSSAEGLFQFLTGTWLEVVHKFGGKHGLEVEAEAIQLVDGEYVVSDETMREHVLDLRRDPYLSALMAAEMKKRDRERIEKRLGRTISRSEFYLAHFFGVNSASKFMTLLDEKPKQSASRVFPAAARANKELFYAKSGRKTRHLSVSEVFDKIDEMIDKRLDRYEDVATVVSADASL